MHRVEADTLIRFHSYSVVKKTHGSGLPSRLPKFRRHQDNGSGKVRSCTRKCAAVHAHRSRKRILAYRKDVVRLLRQLKRRTSLTSVNILVCLFPFPPSSRLTTCTRYISKGRKIVFLFFFARIQQHRRHTTERTGRAHTHTKVKKEHTRAKQSNLS
jgi:hypothetical protein